LWQPGVVRELTNPADDLAKLLKAFVPMESPAGEKSGFNKVRVGRCYVAVRGNRYLLNANNLGDDGFTRSVKHRNLSLLLRSEITDPLDETEKPL